MTSTPLTYRKIFLFWIPLAATWLMMAMEGPFVSALIARLPNEIPNLAAYGVALPLAWLIEAPILMLLSASTALVKDRNSYIKLRTFSLIMNAFVTLTMLIVCIPAVFDFLGVGVIGLPQEVSDLTHSAMVMFSPWPALVGIRRFYQGVLIRSNQTKHVAFGTVIRLSTMIVAGAILYQLSDMSGAAIGGAAHTIGAFFELVAIWIMARPAIRSLKATENVDDRELTQQDILRFYLPLAVTPMLMFTAQPVITFFLTTSRFSTESLAVMPVMISLNFIFNSLAISYMEAAIALSGNRYQHAHKTGKFALGLGIGMSTIMMLIAFTPLAGILFEDILGLSTTLTTFAIPAAQIAFVLPVIRSLNSFMQAVHLIGRHTRPVTISTFIELIIVSIMIYLTTQYSTMSGIACAMTTLAVGRCSTLVTLLPSYRTLRYGKSF